MASTATHALISRTLIVSASALVGALHEFRQMTHGLIWTINLQDISAMELRGWGWHSTACLLRHHPRPECGAHHAGYAPLHSFKFPHDAIPLEANRIVHIIDKRRGLLRRQAGQSSTYPMVRVGIDGMSLSLRWHNNHDRRHAGNGRDAERPNRVAVILLAPARFKRSQELIYIDMATARMVINGQQ